MTRKKPRHRAINIGTTDFQIADAADCLHTYSARLNEGLALCNLSSQFRAKLNRVTDRLEHYARYLGAALTTPDETAFQTRETTRSKLNHLMETTK